MEASSVYIITSKTKALMVADSNYYQTKILDMDQERYTIDPALVILKRSCLRFGSTLSGRKRAASLLLRTNSMLPIAIHPNFGLYMFPTSSEKNTQCVWFSYYAISTYDQNDKHTIVHFRDGTLLEIPITWRIFDNQYKKTSHVIANMIRDSFNLPFL